MQEGKAKSDLGLFHVQGYYKIEWLVCKGKDIKHGFHRLPIKKNRWCTSSLTRIVRHNKSQRVHLPSSRLSHNSGSELVSRSLRLLSYYKHKFWKKFRR